MDWLHLSSVVNRGNKRNYKPLGGHCLARNHKPMGGHYLATTSVMASWAIWRWTDGKYSTKSAYLAQFVGWFTKIKITPICKAKAEAKYRFFSWTPLYKNILTANNLRITWLKGDGLMMWVAGCVETYLKPQPTYAKIVHLPKWSGKFSSNGSITAFLIHWAHRIPFTLLVALQAKGIEKWVEACRFDIYFWWNIRKERNMRQF